MSQTTATIVGNLTADPELRFTQNGKAVANFTIAQTPSSYDKATKEWVDGEPLFMRCTVWNDYAEHVADSLVKGDRVLAIGTLVQRNWEDKETGAKRSVIEMTVSEVGPSLMFATAEVTRVSRKTEAAPKRSRARK